MAKVPIRGDQGSSIHRSGTVMASLSVDGEQLSEIATSKDDPRELIAGLWDRYLQSRDQDIVDPTRQFSGTGVEPPNGVDSPVGIPLLYDHQPSEEIRQRGSRGRIARLSVNHETGEMVVEDSFGNTRVYDGGFQVRGSDIIDYPEEIPAVEPPKAEIKEGGGRSIEF